MPAETRTVRCPGLAPAALALAILFAAPAGAGERGIHDGLTADELVAFAEGEGWRAESSGGGSFVTIEPGGRPAWIVMLDCDAERRCRSGLIRDISYRFLEPDRYGFWHWNMQGLGATGFGPSYVTLQRYLHFSGVTDDYLRQVIGEVWPRAADSFWEAVEARAKAEGTDRTDRPGKGR